MKMFRFLALLITAGLIIVACEGPEGPRGPAGANGTNGVDGVDGTDGEDGNANVKVFDFVGDTLTASLGYTYRYINDTTFSTDSCIVLPYYKNYYWYQVGQMGPGGAYQSRYWYVDLTNQIEIGMRIHNLDGSIYSGADVVWDSIRVFVIPMNTYHMAERANLDFSNYNEVKGYFSEK